MLIRNNNPLAIAVNSNNLEEAEFLLKAKHAFVEPRDFFLAFEPKPETITQEMLALLEKYDALPKNISMSTLKFHLYYRGNPRFSILIMNFVKPI